MLKIDYNGETVSLKELSRRTGIKYQTIHSRYYRLGYRGEQLVKAVEKYPAKPKPIKQKRVRPVFEYGFRWPDNAYDFDEIYEIYRGFKDQVEECWHNQYIADFMGITPGKTSEAILALCEDRYSKARLRRELQSAASHCKATQ